MRRKYIIFRRLSGSKRRLLKSTPKQGGPPNMGFPNMVSNIMCYPPIWCPIVDVDGKTQYLGPHPGQNAEASTSFK